MPALEHSNVSIIITGLASEDLILLATITQNWSLNHGCTGKNTLNPHVTSHPPKIQDGMKQA